MDLPNPATAVGRTVSRLVNVSVPPRKRVDYWWVVYVWFNSCGVRRISPKRMPILAQEVSQANEQGLCLGNNIAWKCLYVRNFL